MMAATRSWPRSLVLHWRVTLVAAVALVAVSTEVGLLVNGLLLGSVLALGAIGITLIYGILRFANIAQGDMMTFGGYVAFLVLTSVLPEDTGLGPFTFGLPVLAAIPVAMAAVAAFAILVDRYVYRRLRRSGAALVTMAIASLGVAIALRGLIQVIWGTQVENYPNESRSQFLLPLDVSIAPNHLFIAGVAMGLAIAVHLLLTRTKQGKAMRAVADNPNLARASGIDSEHVLRWAWGIAGSLAGASGVLLVLFNATAQIKPALGFQQLVPLFAAVILGGIGNPYGAFLGAMLIGVSMEVSTAWVLPTYKPAVAFFIMIVVLLVRPRGILGSRD